MSTTKVNADVLDLADDYAFTGTVTGAGRVVQVVNVQTGAVATGTTVMPTADDTIPQNTEGNEFMTLAITPTNSSNKLIIEVVASATGSAEETMGHALFQDSTAGALAAITIKQQANDSGLASFNHFMAAGTTSETTFKVRIGGHNAGTITFNGYGAARKLGGVMASSITITEIEV